MTSGKTVFMLGGYGEAGRHLVRQLFDGTAHRPGVHHIGILADSDRLLADVKEMGVEIQERTIEI